MRQSVRRWMVGAATLAAVGAAASGQAGAAELTAAAHEGSAARASGYTPPPKPLYFGQKGAAVRSVQRRLAQLHYYPGPVDGEFGADVQQAAWAFRAVQGLPMTAALAAQPINRAFEHALVHPKKPWILVPKGGADRIEINLKLQVLVLYQDGKPSLVLHVSTGGNCLIDQGCGWITPDGNFKALSFAAGWVHVPLGEMYNPVFFIGTAYAIHGDVPVPWFPDSHGCVRIWMDAAAWFHKRVRVGGKHPTPVYIRGIAPYNSLAN